MSEKRQSQHKSLIFIIILAVAAAFTVLYLLPPFDADIINADSTYQYFLTQKSPAEIARLVPEDYSPPLYAALLKLWTMALGNSSLAAMRAFALVPLWGMLFLAAFPIRKAFGGKASVLCTVFFTLSSANFIFVPETRPATLAYFLLTASAVYCYLAFFHRYRYAYICFTVFSVLTMYTHNVGMLAVLSFYIVCVCMSAIRKNFRQSVYFIISGGICGILYIPWLLVVLRQFSNVKDHFWSSTDVSLDRIYDWTIGVCFDDGGTQLLSRVILAVSAFIAAISLLTVKGNRDKIREIKSLRKLNEIITQKFAEPYAKAVFLILLYVGAVLSLLIFCMVGHPVLVPRYFYIFSGIALINIAVFFSKLSGKGATAVLAGIVAVNFTVTALHWKSELDNSDFLDMVDMIREDNPDGDIAFIHAHEWSMGIMLYYFPEARHYIADDTWCVLTDYTLLPKEMLRIGEFEDIGEYEDTAYFFEWVVENEDYTLYDVLSEDGGYDIEEIGTYQEPYTYKKTWKLFRLTDIQ